MGVEAAGHAPEEGDELGVWQVDDDPLHPHHVPARVCGGRREVLQPRAEDAPCSRGGLYTNLFT